MWSERGKHAKRAKLTQKPRLWAAVEDGDEDTVHALLTIGCNVDERYMGWTPLMKAAEEGRMMIALQLLSHRADLEAVNNKGRTALSFAAAPSGGRPTQRETLAFLMAWGADDTHDQLSGYDYDIGIAKAIEGFSGLRRGSWPSP